MHKLDMTPYKAVLGDSVPSLPLSIIGRYRLYKALHGKFGAGFKNNGQAQQLIKHFDQNLERAKAGK